MGKKEKIKKYTKIFETLLFITVVINILLFAYKKENILSRANYKILVQESEGSSNYVAYNGSKFPKSGYTFASYECENGGTITETSKATFTFSGNVDSCVLKFDISPYSCDDNTLYCVIANEALNGGLAAKYTGEHADAYDRSGTEDIYYFTTPIQDDETQGNELLDKWNVVFGGFCWQMLRTTDTGGVKMIYNGIPTNGTCNNTGTAQQIGNSKFNANANSLAYVGYMYNTVYEYHTITPGAYMYGNSFTYSNGTYTLTNTITTTENATESDLNNHHYTCFNTSGTCSSINYIYNLSSSSAYYITLSSGKSVEDAINEMLYNFNVNTNNSTIKTYIDNWYQNNLYSYSNNLEDTVFCNGRNIYSKGGWDPNGGSVSDKYYFRGTYGLRSLECPNNTDRFSTLNNNAKLTYPIGLASVVEMRLIDNTVKNTGEFYWTGSPDSFEKSYSKVSEIHTSPSSLGFAGSVSSSDGVRPVISLKPGTEYASGNGSKNNPYIVDTKKSYTTLNKLQSLNSNIQVNSGTPDFSQIAETDEGVFKADDDYGTSYYWRGAATTNYIQFGKNSSNQNLYWRIIRINGDGSLRLLYAGTSASAKENIGESRYNEDYDDNAYVGYMYGTTGSSTYEATHNNTNTSSIKTYLENWYINNLSGKNFEKYISDTEFCYDRSTINGGFSTEYTIYPSNSRAGNDSPDLKCKQKNDRFTVSDTNIGNGAITKAIGLITYDEGIMAGNTNKNNDLNKDVYIQKNVTYWTGSPYTFTMDGRAWLGNVNETGNLNYEYSSRSLAVVPVVNITPEAVSTLTGSGTVSDPFVVH